MTNFEYIMSGLDDRRLAELFNEGWRGSDYKFKVWDAFNNWADSLPYHKGNGLNPKSGLNGLDPNPFIFNRVFIKTPDNTQDNKSKFSDNTQIYFSDNTQSYGRSFCVAFQDWLLSQYDPTQWK